MDKAAYFESKVLLACIHAHSHMVSKAAIAQTQEHGGAATCTAKPSVNLNQYLLRHSKYSPVPLSIHPSTIRVVTVEVPHCRKSLSYSNSRQSIALSHSEPFCTESSTHDYIPRGASKSDNLRNGTEQTALITCL